MTPKRLHSFMLDTELSAALKEATSRDPELSEASIVRQALRVWFKQNGVPVKTPKRRADTRRKG